MKCLSVVFLVSLTSASPHFTANCEDFFVGACDLSEISVVNRTVTNTPRECQVPKFNIIVQKIGCYTGCVNCRSSVGRTALAFGSPTTTHNASSYIIVERKQGKPHTENRFKRLEKYFFYQYLISCMDCVSGPPYPDFAPCENKTTSPPPTKQSIQRRQTQ